jgi:sugar/nucleoside kinase (ribokinase family)
MADKNYFDLTGVPVVAGTGLIALDVVVHTDVKEPARLYAGGTCGNVLTILSYLGWVSYPIARLNGDEASRYVLADLRRWGAHTEFARIRPTADTPIVIQRFSRSRDNQIVHRFVWTCPNCGAWLPGYKPVHSAGTGRVLAKLKKTNIFFFDRASRGAIILAKAYAEQGALVVFEPSGTGEPRLFREALSHAHVLKYANERMNELSGLHGATSPLLVVETFGVEGLRFRSRIPACRTNGWRKIEACAVLGSKDSAGAGDWCTAGIIHLLGTKGLAGLKTLTEKELKQALDFGQALAAWNCRFEGARGGMYLVDKRRFHQEVNQILFGTALEASQRISRLKAAPEFLKCLAPKCNPHSAIHNKTNSYHRPALSSRLIPATSRMKVKGPHY